MKLYEVQATEFNGEQAYSKSKLLAARNIKHARQLARDYFQLWYDDGEDPKSRNTGNIDEFEFLGGGIRLRIDSVREIIIDDWIADEISSHSISKLPDELMTTQNMRSALELLEACKVLTSYTMDLLRRLDDQVDISDIEEVQQAIDAIAKCEAAIKL